MTLSPKTSGPNQRGAAILLLALGISVTLGMMAITNQVLSSGQNKIGISAINKAEGFYISEIAAWHSYLRGPLSLPSNHDANGFYPANGDLKLFGSYNKLFPASFPDHVYNPGKVRLTLKSTGRLDSGFSTVRRFTNNNVRFLPKLTVGVRSNYCGNSSYDGVQKLYSTCLSQ